MVYCTKQQEICQESQRSDVATGNARWPTQRTTHNAAMRCTKLWVVFPWRPYPDLPFLAFWDFLAFFVARNVLVFLSIFPSFPGILGVQRGEDILAFLGGFLARSKKTRKGRSGQPIKLRSLDSSFPFLLCGSSIWGQGTQSQGNNSFNGLQMR